MHCIALHVDNTRNVRVEIEVELNRVLKTEGIARCDSLAREYQSGQVKLTPSSRDKDNRDGKKGKQEKKTETRENNDGTTFSFFVLARGSFQDTCICNLAWTCRASREVVVFFWFLHDGAAATGGNCRRRDVLVGYFHAEGTWFCVTDTKIETEGANEVWGSRQKHKHTLDDGSRLSDLRGRHFDRWI